MRPSRQKGCVVGLALLGLAAGCCGVPWVKPASRGAAADTAARVRPGPRPGMVDVLGQFEAAAPVRFSGQAFSGLVEHTFAPVGEDRDPDVRGGLMVFSSTRHREQANLYLLRVGGGAVVQLTDDRFDNIEPALSPDGSQVAFASNRNGNWDIFVMQVSGGAVTQVTESDDHEVHPTWSPDGSRLAYSALSARAGRWEINVVPVGEGTRRRMLVAEGLFPVWSRTGEVAFQRARQQGERWFSVWRVSVDGERVGRPAEVVAGAEWAAIAPAWSPDGSRLVFAAVNHDRLMPSSGPVPHADSIWMVRADGEELIRLTGAGESASAPVWGDDGRVYFASDRSGRRHIWSVRPVGPAEAAPEARQAAHVAGASPALDR